MATAPGLSTTRSTANTAAEHVSDHNTAHGVLNVIYAASIGTTRTASFTVAAADSGDVIPCNSASAITVTLPVLSAGHVSQFVRQGAGSLTFTTSGTTILKASDVALTARVQGSGVTATYLTATLVWLQGDLT